MINRDEKIQHELIVYKSGSSLLGTVRYIKEYTGCGLKTAKWFVDTLPDRRKDDFDIDEDNKLLNELDIELTKDSSIFKIMMSLDTAESFRLRLLECGNEFYLSALKSIREDKLGEILD